MIPVNVNGGKRFWKSVEGNKRTFDRAESRSRSRERERIPKYFWTRSNQRQIVIEKSNHQEIRKWVFIDPRDTYHLKMLIPEEHDIQTHRHLEIDPFLPPFDVPKSKLKASVHSGKESNIPEFSSA